MKSLALLCHDSGIPERQKNIFCSNLLDLLCTNQAPVEIALVSLRLLWTRYDTGGISVGRSLRSLLLDEIISVLAKRSRGGEERVRVLLSVLLGMYHDHSYIRAMSWYDYPVHHFSDSSLLHRVWLSAAAFSLEIDEVAEMSEWSTDRLLTLLRGD